MIPGGVNELLLRSAGAAGPTAGRSVRFNSADSAYLSRTPASAGNRKTWTWSGWVKRSALGTFQYIWGNANSSAENGFMLRFDSGDVIRIADWTNTAVWQKITSQVFRDVSAWYHILISYDTTNATAADRVRLYINGTRVTAFSTSTDPTQNYDGYINNTNPDSIGRWGAQAAYYLDGYLALVHFIDGQALTPSSFGETSATTGQWIAKTYSGTYGTNGFFLDFSDNSGATSTTLGKDAAGSNNWTPNNLSVTAGSGNDSLRDHPTSAGTSTGAGGEVSGNYCVLNPLKTTGVNANASDSTLSDGNLVATNSSTGWDCRVGSLGVSTGKWYYEYVVGVSIANFLGGWADAQNLNFTDGVGNTSRSYGYYNYGYTRNSNNNSATNYGSYTTGDVISCAIDLDNGKIYWAKNGTWINSANPASGTGSIYTVTTGYTYFPAVSTYDNTQTVTCNFGQRAFAYTAPSGFSPLVDTLLPTPTIAKPNTVMDVKLYTGTGSSQNITGFNFSPDFVWAKARDSSVYSLQVIDIIRGGTNVMFSNLTDAEDTYQSISAFNSDGFTVSTNAGINGSGNSFVAWCWDAGSSNATNTSGTITSTVRANISAGFSVVTYTGNGTAGATIGHGLGVAPEMVIVKCRSNSNDWAVYHAANTSDPKTDYLLLNSTAATADDNTYWNDTAPTSTLVTLGTNTDVNTNNYTYVAYCWTPVAGYSAFGSYTGTGSGTTGPFVYTGMRPRWILIKRTDSGSTNNWVLHDTARSPYNVATSVLYPNLSNAEDTTSDIDILSNGFRIRDGGLQVNASSGTYVWAAFAENPFQYARAR